MTPPDPAASLHASPDDAAVRARGLTKAYHVPAAVRRQARRVHGRTLPATTRALDGIDLTVAPGQVYGILGPNGAGKTTLMKVLGTVLLPDEGQVEVLGHDLAREPTALRRRLGIVLGEYERTFHWRLTGRQNLDFFAAFLELPRHETADRIAATLETVGLTDAADTPFHAYSTGMKHRLALARGLLPDPALLILDEPTAGLDAHSSARIAEVVRDRAAAGTTVLYTTHRIQEAGQIADRILVLHAGRAIADATPAELSRRAAGEQVIEARRPDRAPWSGELVRRITGIDGVRDWETRGPRLLFFVDNDDTLARDVVAALRVHGGADLAVTIRPPDVEDAFRSLVAAQDGGST